MKEVWNIGMTTEALQTLKVEHNIFHNYSPIHLKKDHVMDY